MIKNNFEKFKGVFTALITPFDERNDKIAFSDIASLIHSQIDGGVNGLLLLGSTSEAPTLSEEEKCQILQFALEIIDKRVPVMIGINYNDTAYAASITKKFVKILKEKGHSDASFLVNSPSYNKPKEDGIFAHFEEIHNSASDFPLFVYNIPSRSIADLTNNFLKKVFTKLERFVGLKDCSGQINRVFELESWANENLQNKKLHLFCGDDNLFFSHFVNGGCGVISVCSNLLPIQMSQMWNFLESGNLNEAAKIHRKLMPVFDALFIEPNPSPLKYLMSKKFGIQNLFRLPLLPVSEFSSEILKKLSIDFENKE